MSNESPFFLSKVECPICKTINEYETVKVGAFYENGRDTDFCPKEIQWRYPRYQAYNPLVFFTATCSNCFYTREFSNSFKDWKNDNNFRAYRLKTVKEKHLDQLATADSIIRTMGEALNVTGHPNETAILKLHLAIFDEELAERSSNLDLGRFYLRIAWVYRDLERGENPGVQFLKGLMLEIDTQFHQMKEAISNSRARLESFSRHLLSHFESGELTADVKSRMFPYREKFQPGINDLENLIVDSEKKIEEYSTLLNEYKAAALGDAGGDAGVAFGRYHSFTEFLLTLKSRWGGIVTNEKEAMEKAIHYYVEAFAGGRDISPGNQQIQASYLIAELSRRIGDYDQARQYFNSTIKHGQEFIYQNRKDPSRTALARKILELAIEQGKANMEALKSA
ncbi:MAG: DUF2225 domain-containing protein [Candidatus Zixiibacteriota bacterium]